MKNDNKSDAFQFVKENVDILEYLESIVGNVKKDGSSRARCKCPIHGGDNPNSLSVDIERGLFKCFSCGAQGSVIDLYAGVNDMEVDRELLEKMAREFRVTLPKRELKQAVTRKQIVKALNDIADRCADALSPEDGDPEGDAVIARAYLASRMVGNPKLEDRFFDHGIGFLSKDTLRQIEKDYKPEVLEAAGFLSPRAQTGGYYCRIVNRITFPVRDERGDVIAISGRIVPEFVSVDGETEGPIDTIIDSKYLNPTNGEAYDKSRDIYDIEWLYIKGVNTCIVTEGYMDSFAINETVNYIDDSLASVALCGTALSTTHARNLADCVDRIIFMTDGDSAGASSAINSAWIQYEYPDVDVHPASHLLPDGKDPFDIIRESKNGADEIIQVIDKSLSHNLGAYAIECKLKEFEGEPSKFYRWCKSMYRRISNDEGRRDFVRDVAITSGVPTQAVAVEIAVKESTRNSDSDRPIADISDIEVSPSVISLTRFAMGVNTDSGDSRRLRHSYASMGTLADVVLKRWFGFSEDYEVEAFRCAVRGDVPSSQEASVILTSAMDADSGNEPVASIVKSAFDLMNREDVVSLNRKDFAIVWRMTSQFIKSAYRAKRPGDAAFMLCSAMEMGAAIMNIRIELDEEYSD